MLEFTNRAVGKQGFLPGVSNRPAGSTSKTWPTYWVAGGRRIARGRLEAEAAGPIHQRISSLMLQEGGKPQETRDAEVKSGIRNLQSDLRSPAG